MKKNILFLTIITASIVLLSCGKTNNTDTTTGASDTGWIQTRAEAQKICAPFIKYLTCSLEKAPADKKEINKKILSETEQKIQTEEPARMAQQCDTYIKILKDNPEIAFKNGCTLDDK